MQNFGASPGAANSFPSHSPDPPQATARAPGTVSTLLGTAARFLFFLPAIAPIGVFFFALLWFASGILLGTGKISSARLAFFAALLALDCLPRAMLTSGRFDRIRPTPPNLTSAAAATEFALSLLLTLYTIYAAIFWAFVLTLGLILTRAFLL